MMEIGMITDESIYSITLKITTTVLLSSATASDIDCSLKVER